MNIELSAVKSWKDANKDAAEKRVLQRSAMARVVLPLAERLLAGETPNYLHEIGKIVENTDGDEATRDAQLHQIMGIAEQQGILVYEEVEAQIARITDPNALRNVDITRMMNVIMDNSQERTDRNAAQRMIDDINARLNGPKL